MHLHYGLRTMFFAVVISKIAAKASQVLCFVGSFCSIVFEWLFINCGILFDLCMWLGDDMHLLSED